MGECRTIKNRGTEIKVKPGVTYIICTFNRGDFLKQNLQDQILSNHLNIGELNFDITIVDDGSNDGTLDKIKQICNGKLGIPLKYIYLKRRAGNYRYSDSAPKNTAIVYSNSEFIYVADSDCYICNSDIFHRLTNLEPNTYLCPNMFRLSSAESELHQYCLKNWMYPSKCYEYYKKNGISPGVEYFPTAHDETANWWHDPIKIGIISFKCGLFGMRKNVIYNANGMPFFEKGGSSDDAMAKLVKNHNIALDKDNSKLLVVHFGVPYYTDPLEWPSPYSAIYYEKIDGITVVKKNIWMYII